ncbi:MAG: squalene/phytoene synthase family protein [Planctomycetaceae bacterium]
MGAGFPVRPAPSLRESEAYCRQLASSHYENFPVVSWLLPRKWHQDFFNVYAYCRWADDLGDEITPELSEQVGKTSLELLDWWREELALCHLLNPGTRSLSPWSGRFRNVRFLNNPLKI